MSKPCEQQAEIARYLFEDDLPPSERRQMDEHLRQCSACQRELSELTAMTEQLQGFPEMAPSRSLLLAEPGESWWTSWIRRPGIGWATALVALLTVTLVAAASGFQMRAEKGAVTLGFGDAQQSVRELVESRDALRRSELLAVSDELARYRAAVENLNRQLAALEGTLEQQQSDLHLAVKRVEGQLSRRLTQQEETLDSALELASADLQSLALRQQRALDLLNQRINLVAASGQLKESQNEMLLATLIEVANIRGLPGAGRRGSLQ